MSSTDLDRSSYLQLLNSLNPLVPRLDLFHDSDCISMSISNINEGLGYLSIVMLNNLHRTLIICFIGSVHYW
jgi:hypothetical protein